MDRVSMMYRSISIIRSMVSVVKTEGKGDYRVENIRTLQFSQIKLDSD